MQFEVRITKEIRNMFELGKFIIPLTTHVLTFVVLAANVIYSLNEKN